MTASLQSYIAIPKDRSGAPSGISQSQLSLLDDFSSGDDNGSIAIIAPCDMDEGYTFMVSTNDGYGEEDIIPVTVPPGGIRQGQIFYSTSRSFANNSRNQSFSSCSTTLKIGSISSNISEWTPLVHQQSNHDLSFGQWKDRWFDCCRLGFCHVTLWNACCCPQILAAQVLTRLQLNWLGDPQHETDPHHRKVPGKTNRDTFYHVLLVVISYWGLSTLLDPNHLPGPTSLILNEILLFHDIHERRQEGENYTLYNVINFFFGIYTLLLLTKLRYQTRRAHRIPPSNSGDVTNSSCLGWKNSDIQNVNISYTDENQVTVDDCCMAVFCACCSVAQMARQTASYHKCNCNDDLSNMDHQYEHAVCCSIDGLPQQGA